MVPSDIYLVAEQKPHELYTRMGSDLVLLVKVSLVEHLAGATKYIRHLEAQPSGNGFKILKVKIPPLKTKLVVKGKGMPKTALHEGKFFFGI